MEYVALFLILMLVKNRRLNRQRRLLESVEGARHE